MDDREDINYYGDWSESVGKNSKRAYQAAWDTLIEFYKAVKKEAVTPNVLMEKMIEDRKKPLDKQGVIEKDINKWIAWLEKDYVKKARGIKYGKTHVKGISAKSIKMYMAAIKSFFSYYGYPLSKKVKLPRRIKLSNGKIENTKIEYRPEQVKKLLDVMKSPRDKAIALMMFQSGMDISTICSLDYGDIKEGLGKGEEPLMIHVERPKVGLNYRTFIGHDTIDALKLYLNERRVKHKEKITFDTPLFVSAGTHVKKRKRIIPKNFQDNMRDYVLLAGLVSEERLKRADFSPARPHALRAGFSTIARLKGLNEKLIDYFMGHSDSYGGAYNIITNDELKEKYLEIEPGLSVSSVSSLNDVERRLRKEIEKQGYIIQGYEKKFDDLTKRMDESEKADKAVYNILRVIKDEAPETLKKALEKANLEETLKDLKINK